MNYKYSISLDIPHDVYEYIENNHGKLSYSNFIEKIIRERMKSK
jgi:predicted CopG family antitoxin